MAHSMNKTTSPPSRSSNAGGSGPTGTPPLDTWLTLVLYSYCSKEVSWTLTNSFPPASRPSALTLPFLPLPVIPISPWLSPFAYSGSQHWLSQTQGNLCSPGETLLGMSNPHKSLKSFQDPLFTGFKGDFEVTSGFKCELSCFSSWICFSS